MVQANASGSHHRYPPALGFSSQSAIEVSSLLASSPPFHLGWYRDLASLHLTFSWQRHSNSHAATSRRSTSFVFRTTTDSRRHDTSARDRSSPLFSRAELRRRLVAFSPRGEFVPRSPTRRLPQPRSALAGLISSAKRAASKPSPPYDRLRPRSGDSPLLTRSMRPLIPSAAPYLLQVMRSVIMRRPG